MELDAPGWRENTCYPGTHWLFHDQRRNYAARVDYAKWTKGQYMWRVMGNLIGTDIVGWESTLEDAQKAAETALDKKSYQQKEINPDTSGKPYQMKLF